MVFMNPSYRIRVLFFRLTCEFHIICRECNAIVHVDHDFFHMHNIMYGEFHANTITNNSLKRVVRLKRFLFLKVVVTGTCEMIKHRILYLKLFSLET